MGDFNIYKDIAERTQGDIYLGVVGPVRTGKSTFIKKFMDLMVIPKIDNAYKKERAKDELPQSGSGKTIHTTEPKFVPNEAVEITIDEDIKLKVRMVDCVGYIVKGALGYLEDEEPKMVNTPWYEYEIPFEDAAEIEADYDVDVSDCVMNCSTCKNNIEFPPPHTCDICTSLDQDEEYGMWEAKE